MLDAESGKDVQGSSRYLRTAVNRVLVEQPATKSKGGGVGVRGMIAALTRSNHVAATWRLSYDQALYKQLSVT